MARSGKQRGAGGVRQRRPTGADGQVGAAIRAHRLMRGMSQVTLAEKLGVTFQQVQKYEKGTNRVGAGRLPLIAKIFGVPIGDLFQEETGATGNGSAAVPTKLVTDTATVRLLTAYASIQNGAIRRNISELVERIAVSSSPPTRKKPRR
jgi:transcriptional regulator with XRE-family HTH domain